MPSLGPLELILILVIVLLIFGVGRLPDVFKSLGSGIREFREAASGDLNENKKTELESKDKPVDTPAENS